MPIPIQIFFHITDEIFDGLRTGRYIRYGGVIKDRNGTIKCWLRESTPLQGQLRQSPLGFLPDMGVGTQFLQNAGLQALTMSMMKVEFNLIHQRLEEINRNLQQVRNELVWLDQRQDAALLAELLAGIEMAKWAEETNRLDNLIQIRGTFAKAAHHYRNLMRSQLDSHRAHEQSEVYSHYFQMHILSGIGKVRCDLLLDGIPASIKSLEKVTNTAKESLRAFRVPLKNMENHPHLLQIPPNKRQAIQVYRDVMVETLKRVEGYRSELEFCERNDISFQEWETLGEECKDPQWICIIPQKEHLSA